ncbi:MAG: PAS domain S-box protein, partial [Verrucomicrobiota bacterium]
MKSDPIHPASKDVLAELARTQNRLDESERKFRQSEALLLQETTQRQALQGALHANEDMHRIAFDLAAVGMACVNADGRLFRVNDKYCEITGYSQEELLGTSVLNLTHPEDLKKEGEDYSVYLKGQQSNFSSEKRYLRKDGAVRWVSVAAHPVRDAQGRLCYSIGTVEDITERKQTDEHLRQLLQQLKFHVENSPLAVIEFDTDLRISRWSSAAERVFGWSAEEVLGRGMFDIPWVHVEDLSQIQKVAEELRSGHDPRNVTPNRNYRKDGTVIHCEWYNSSLQDANGKLVSILSLVLDVTARTNAKELLRLQAQQLEAFVRERTAKLKESIDELHQISYALVHDMRAPLRAMQSFAELVEGECSGCTRANTHEYHQRIIAATERLDRLVTDAFHYTKTL